jgi:RND family efflux transporter MFP subunit
MNETESDQTKPPASPPADTLRQVKLVGAAVIVVLLVFAAVIIGLLPRWHQRAALAAETSELAIPSVSVVLPTAGKAAGGLLLSAEVKPWIEAPIYARASGYLKRWLVDLGTRVEAGQLLAEIETPEVDQELERTRQELAQSEAALALAKITTDRYTELLKTASVSEQETAEKQADFVLKSATVKAGHANLRRLEQLQSFGRVTAPFAGVITLRKTDVGDLITAGGAKELFRLAQTDKLRVSVHVPQTRALATAPGQLAELLLAELPGRVFTGQVARTAGVISTDSRTLLTELELDNARGEILAGSFAQARFTEAKGAGPLTLPGNTLLFRAEGPQVGVVRADSTVELRSVKLGRDFGQAVEILAGVSPTNQVILNPSDSLANGDTVRAVAVAKPEAAQPGKAK